MRKIKWTEWGDDAESLQQCVIIWLRRRGQESNERFQRWYLTVPARRMKIYLLLAGVLLLVLFVFFLSVGFSNLIGSDFGHLNVPAHIILDQTEREAGARRAIRSQLHFQALIDSLRRDSTGNALLDSLIRQGRIKLDSTMFN
jgi:hypothetical protein